ncbi:solute carrier family 22 member 6-like [Haemaphysalis longicornis]
MEAGAPESRAIAFTEASPSLKTRGAGELAYGNGLFQLLTIVSTAIGSYLYLLHVERFRLTAGVMDHWCERPVAFGNLSVDEWKWLAIPLDEHGQRSHCLVRDPPEGSEDSRLIRCSSWEFDLASFGNNAMSEWNLVCNRSWLHSLLRITHALGAMIALPAAGVAADKVGRKTVTFLTVPVVLIAGVASSLPKDFHFYVAVGTALSAATGSLVPPLWALLYEVSPAHMVAPYAGATSIAVVVMIPATLLIASLTSGECKSVQLALMVPTALLLALYYTVSESPAWLTARGRIAEAEHVTLRAARLNRVELPRSREKIVGAVGQRQLLEPHADGLCAARFRLRTALSCYMWVVMGFANETFYLREGVQMADSNNALGFALSAACIFAGFVYLPRVGVKRAVALSGIICSTCTALLAATYTRERTLVREVLVTLMRIAGYSTFSVFFLMTAGMYPVTARSTALGTALSLVRFGETVVQLLATPQHLKRLLIAVTALLTALYAAAAEFLPDELQGAAQQMTAVANHGGIPSGLDLRRAMQATLEPLSKKPMEARQKKAFVENVRGPRKTSLWSSGRQR